MSTLMATPIVIQNSAVGIAIYLKSINAVFLANALYVLQVLANTTLPHLANVLQLLSNNCRLPLQWIPVHCGVHENEQADTLAKQGAHIEQPCIM